MKLIGRIFWACVALWFFAGCGTAPPLSSWDRCDTGRVMDACSVDDYPPLTAILPPWPFPRLIAEPPPPQKTTDTPAGDLLRKLGK